MHDHFSDYLYKDENALIDELLAELPWDKQRAHRVHDHAVDLVNAVRATKAPVGQLETFMKDYSLQTEEGLALMCLAEALLRVPDKATANMLIRDKVVAANWLDAAGDTKDWVVKAAGVGLFMTGRTLEGVFARIGEPFIREAMVRAMQVLGKQFVLGQDIEGAVQRAEKLRKKGYRISYDMLGEAARTAVDAQNYFDSYVHAIEYIGERGSKDKVRRPGISVKLSALHPRYEFAQSEICVPALQDSLLELCEMAAKYDVTLTVDAEEVNRLEMSLEIIEGVLPQLDPKWNGFGLVVQAYQKRAMPLIDHLAGLSRKHGRQLQVRLVKGAYWDSEIKHAQEMGVDDFPVYTRKANTDLSYLACAHRLFTHGDAFYPMLATHNAHSLAAIIEMGKDTQARYECQRLYGMGQALFDRVVEEAGVHGCVYAPVGAHGELLPYLVRRLLENGANTSFVNRMLDDNEPAGDIVADPVEKIRARSEHRHPNIRRPYELYNVEPGAYRSNSPGLDLDDPQSVDTLLLGMQNYTGQYSACPSVGGDLYQDGVSEPVVNPANDDDQVGVCWPAQKGLVNKAMRTAREAFIEWSGTDVQVRAQILEKIADMYIENRDEILALLVREAGKTIPDALDEYREAIDFCRYYAKKGREDFTAEGTLLPGPTGEKNYYMMTGRGVFVCISPWNFPLAIFTGQVVAALMAGNCVVAKPAEQTPLIASLAVSCMYEAGIPHDVLALMPGDGLIGEALVDHKDVAGVAFTGSTGVACAINRSLAAKDGAIVPLIAETGGQNTMIVDSSALPEQVIDDVVHSAFGSAGQRCSALRVLCIQDDVADQMIRMLQGAIAQLSVGNPALLSTDIGPVIDEGARGVLFKHREALQGFGRFICEADVDMDILDGGYFFTPCVYEIPSVAALKNEVFGPVLHVVRYKKSELDDLLADIDASGYALTLGVHSRIDSFQKRIVNRVRAGNAYVNRSMTGAIVGSQPFGGHGLSGTGPKAGGPHYLHRFATERVVSIDVTAMGGNASLVSLAE